MPESPKGRTKRMRAFFHNSLVGRLAMMRANLSIISESNTVNFEGKKIALQMLLLSDQLREALKTRVDPPDFDTLSGTGNGKTTIILDEFG